MWREKFGESRPAGEAFCRATTMVYNRGDLVTCRVLGRYKVTGEACNEDIMPCLVMDGFWEAWVTRMLLGYVRPGFVCVNVGANVGYYSLVMAELSGPSGRVYAFEPETDTYDILEGNIRDNGFRGRIIPREEACGAAKGSAKLYASRRISGGSTVGVRLPDHYEQTERRVDVVRLDESIPSKKTDIIVCDAEGMDAEVFMGAEGLFRNNPALLMVAEYDPAHAAKMRPAIEFAATMGVVPWSIDGEGAVRRTTADAVLSGPFTNFILARGS